METTAIAVACTAAATGALVQGSLGFGMSLLASPILAMVDTRLVPGPLGFCGIFVSLLTLARDWRHARWKQLPLVLPGLLIGSWAGAALLRAVPPPMLSTILGLVVLVAVGISAAGHTVRATRSNLVLASVIAGFLDTTAAIPGPPLALIYQHRGHKLAGTLAPIFLFSGVISLFNLHAIGRFGRAEIELGSMLIGPVVLGLAASSLLVGRLPAPAMRIGVLALSALAGIAAIVRGF